MTVPQTIYVIEDRRAVFRCQTMPMISVIKRSTPNDNMWEFMGAFVHPSFSSGMPGSPQTQKPRRRPGEAIAPLKTRRNMAKYITEKTSPKSQKGLYTMTEMKVVSSFDSFAQHTESTKVYFRQKKCRFLRSPEMDRNLEVKAWLKKTLLNELANPWPD